MSTPEPPTPPIGFPVPRRRYPVVPVVLAAIVGLVLGAGVVGLWWSLSADSDDGAGADAAAACAAVARTPRFTEIKDVTLPSVRRLAAASELMAVAAEADAAYRAPAEALDNIQQRIQNLDLGREFNQELDKVTDLCADV